jgi:hypothetical protein
MQSVREDIKDDHSLRFSEVLPGVGEHGFE